MSRLGPALRAATLSALLIAGVAASACHAPVTITTQLGHAQYTADQVVKRLGEFQQATIDAQRKGKIALPLSRTIVTWISGDRSQTPPVLGAVDVLETAPLNWKATVQASWKVVRTRVLATPELSGWVPTIDQLLDGVQA